MQEDIFVSGNPGRWTESASVPYTPDARESHFEYYPSNSRQVRLRTEFFFNDAVTVTRYTPSGSELIAVFWRGDFITIFYAGTGKKQTKTIQEFMHLYRSPPEDTATGTVLALMRRMVDP